MNGQNVELVRDDGRRPEGRRDCKPDEVAAYVCDITGDLKKLARCADLKFLAYLIDMVHIEAFNVLNASRAAQTKRRD